MLSSCRAAKFSLVYMETSVRRGILMNAGQGSRRDLAMAGYFFFRTLPRYKQPAAIVTKTPNHVAWSHFFQGQHPAHTLCVFGLALQPARAALRVASVATLERSPSLPLPLIRQRPLVQPERLGPSSAVRAI